MSITITNVEKSFQDKLVLKQISLEANAAEILGLIGPSGAGKTTLIRAVIGSLEVDSGLIQMGGITVPNKQLFQNFGFMPQGDAIYNDLSGLDNLRFFGKLYGLKGKKLQARCTEFLTFMGLIEDQHKLVEKYSGGMKKRLSLIIALLHDPEFLILDEPTVGIDPALRQKIWNAFEQMAKNGKTIIISTHVMDEALRCAKCALIKDGMVVAYGSVDSLLEQTEHNNLEELFFRDEEETANVGNNSTDF